MGDWPKPTLELELGAEGYPHYGNITTETNSTRGSTVRDAAKKIMGDVTIAYIEGIGGVRVAEDELVEVGKNDVRIPFPFPFSFPNLISVTNHCFFPQQILSFKVGK